MKTMLPTIIALGSLSLVLGCSYPIASKVVRQPSPEKTIITQKQSKSSLSEKNNHPSPLKSSVVSVASTKAPPSASPYSFSQVVCIGGKVGQKKIEGSGFVIAKKGYILASKHQVENASGLTAYFQDGSSHVAKLLSVSESLDLALLQIPIQEVEPLLFDQALGFPQVGTPVIALGCPLGLNHSASKGIISAPERKLDGMRLLQTDVAINPGNSGGPLLNQEGKVAGVVVGVFKNARGISFALPAKEARRFLGESFFKIGTLFAEKNRHGDALDALLISVSFWSESAKTQNNLGEVYRRIEKYKVSEDAFLQALSFDPQYADAHYNLGILYGNHLNNPKKAALHYRKYLKLAPNSADAAEVGKWLSVAEAKQ